MNLFSFEDTVLAARVPTPLLAWYDRNKREMPWRGAANAYAIWVSEIMLQQTRVEAVRAYYTRFIAELPTLQALAQCTEDRLMKLWQGLGYYNRARNLQRAARIVTEQHGGVLPQSYNELLALPGIGDYTAGAVASIAYGLPVPCVDGNVLRVLSRILASNADISCPPVKAAYRALAQGMIPPARAGDFNQSLMELGACVCLPNGAPLCGTCPLAELCRACSAKTQACYPVKSPKAARRSEQRTVLLLLCNGRILLTRRPKTGLLANLWELPSFDGCLTENAVQQAASSYGGGIEAVIPLGDAKHIFTHREWHMRGFAVRLATPCNVANSEWATPTEIAAHYALPSAFSAYSARIEEVCR